MKPAAILFGAAFTVSIAFALGSLLLRGVADRLHRWELRILAFITGSACLSCLVFWISLAGFARRPVFLALGAAVLFAAFQFRSSLKPLKALPALDRTWFAPYVLVFGAFVLFYLPHAMKPEASPDGGTYHLGLVAQFHREGGIVPVYENLYAAFPKGMEMLFLFAFAFGGHSAAALVHFAFLLGLAAGLLVFARRMNHAGAGAVASLLLLLSPAAGMNGTTAYNDVALAAAGFGAFWLLELWKGARWPVLLFCAGLAAGFAFSIKYTGCVAVAYTLMVAGRYAWRTGLPIGRTLVLAATPAALAAGPYLIYNWVVRGNPFSPFLNQWFPNPWVHVSFERMAGELMRYYPGLPSYWDIPRELTVRGVVLQGLLGPVFLLAPAAILTARCAFGRRLLTAAAVFALPFAGNMGTRFLIPCLPFLCLAMGLALARRPRIATAVLLAHAVTVVPRITELYAAQGVVLLYGWPVRQALRLTPEEDAILRLSPCFDVSRMVNRHVPPDATVFAFAWVMDAYTMPRVRTHHLSAANERLAETLWTAITPELQPVRRYSFTFPEQRLRAIRVVQAASAAPSAMPRRREPGFILDQPRLYPEHWSVAELHLARDGVPLPRRDTWRATAAPNWWDAALAFDGNPATSWKTWETASPGMFLELEFSAPETTDQVTFDSPLVQQPLAFRLEGQDENEAWRVLSENAAETRAAVPQDLRRHASAALESEGIGYIVVDPGLAGARDFQEQTALWDLRFVEEAANGVRLYEVVRGSGGRQMDSLTERRLGNRLP